MESWLNIISVVINKDGSKYFKTYMHVTSSIGKTNHGEKEENIQFNNGKS